MCPTSYIMFCYVLHQMKHCTLLFVTYESIVFNALDAELDKLYLIGALSLIYHWLSLVYLDLEKSIWKHETFWSFGLDRWSSRWIQTLQTKRSFLDILIININKYQQIPGLCWYLKKIFIKNFAYFIAWKKSFQRYSIIYVWNARRRNHSMGYKIKLIGIKPDLTNCIRWLALLW